MRILRYEQDGTEYWGALKEHEEVIPMLDPLTMEVKKGACTAAAGPRTAGAR